MIIQKRYVYAGQKVLATVIKRIWFSTMTATNCDAVRPQGPTPGPNVLTSAPSVDVSLES